jgi:hypothetical protein
MLRTSHDSAFEIEELPDSDDESQPKKIEAGKNIVVPVQFAYEPHNPPALKDLFNGELEFALSLPFPRLDSGHGLPAAISSSQAQTRHNGEGEATSYVAQKCPRLPSDEVYQALRQKRLKEDNSLSDHDSDYVSPGHKLFKSKDETFRRVTRSQSREQQKPATVTTNNKGM